MLKSTLTAVGTLNCHMGAVVAHGGLNWAMQHHPAVSIWFLQEVLGPETLKRHVNLNRWNAIHVAPAHMETGVSPKTMLDSVILYKRERYELVSSEARYNGHGEKTKAGRKRARYSTVGILHDKVTDRRVLPGSMHNAPLGKGFEHASKGARGIHTAQVKQYVDWFDVNGEDQDVLLLGGDWNERLGVEMPEDLYPISAAGQLQRIGMSFAHEHVKGGEVGLDDIAFSQDPFMHPHSRQTFWTPAKGEDHPGCVVRFHIDHL